MAVDERLQALGVALPPAPKPAGSYVPAVRTGDLVWSAGQLPYVNGTLTVTGKVGNEVSQDDAYAAARTCALNALAAIQSVIVDLNRIVRVVRVNGYVSSADGFTAQPAVINGASDLLVAIFGDAGKHSRAAIGVYQLPSDSPVEVDIVVEVTG